MRPITTPTVRRVDEPDRDVDDETVDELCRRVTNRTGDVRQIVDGEVRLVAPLLIPDQQRRLADRAIARLSGLGDLERLLDDPTVDEIMVNSDCDIWVDRRGSLTRAGRLDHQRVEHLIERILAPIGRRVDRTSPIVDARLPDGSRVCAVLPPVAANGAVLSIRRFSTEVRPLTDFVEGAGLDLCREIVDTRCNVIVSGATSSGKTSLLAALVAEVAPDERLLVIEDTSELPVTSRNVVRLEARPALADGPPPVELADLVRAALRLRPDRIVVGEVRGDEVLALVQAMNTGHDGSVSTCHSNGPLDTLLRLESLVLQAAPSWPLAAIRHQIERSVDVVIHVARRPHGGQRTVSSIHEVTATSGGGGHSMPATRPLAAVDATGDLQQVGALERRRSRT